MFTGIVEETGIIKGVQKGINSSSLLIQGSIIFQDLRLGDSVAVNGVCLTVSGCSKNIFTADVMQETLNRSALGLLKTGSHVNLERALPANGRFGGHIVSGHIDGTGVITQIKKDGIAIWYTIRASGQIMKYIVEKGSVAVDGISLTAAKVTAGSFLVSVIPHTLNNTILSEKSIGDKVNLENDLIGKYIEKLAAYPQKSKTQSNITGEFLNKLGY